MGADFLLDSIPARSTKLSLPCCSPPVAWIALSQIVKIPCPREERGFIAIAATTRLPRGGPSWMPGPQCHGAPLWEAVAAWRSRALGRRDETVGHDHGARPPPRKRSKCPTERRVPSAGRGVLAGRSVRAGREVLAGSGTAGERW